jgi:hypothetical protein
MQAARKAKGYAAVGRLGGRFTDAGLRAEAAGASRPLASAADAKRRPDVDSRPGAQAATTATSASFGYCTPMS